MTLLILAISAIVSGTLFLYLTHQHNKYSKSNQRNGNSTRTYIFMEFASILALVTVFWQFFYMMTVSESKLVFIYFIVTSVLVCYIILFNTKMKLPFDLLSKFKSRDNFKSFASIGMYLSLEEFLLLPVVLIYLIQFGIAI